MGARRSDRLWLFGGIFAIVMIVAATYLLAIKPVYTRRDEYRDMAADSEVTMISLKRDLAKLQTEFKDRAKYTAALNVQTGHLPATYDMPNFVRSLQASGIATSVSVSGITVGAPEKVAALSTVASLPITLTATGTAANISKFLNRLQIVQSRAVLINSVNLAEADGGDVTASLMLDAFCTTNKVCIAPQS